MMEQNTTKLSGSSILKTLLRFAGPFLIANLLQTAYSAADMIIVEKSIPAPQIRK